MFRGKRHLVTQKKPLGSLWKVLLLPTLLVFGALLVLAASQSYTVDSDFEDFVSEYEKKYSSNAEFKHRQAVFMRNKAYIEDFNARNSGFSMGINQFSDMTEEEMYKSPLPGLSLAPQTSSNLPLPADTPPTALDWAKLGLVTEVKNERDCATSWIFAPIAAAESLFAILNQREKLLYEFSEQEVFDCCYVNLAPCFEGLPGDAFSCMTKGIALEAAYPYEAVRGLCHDFNSTYAVAGSAAVPSVYQTIIQVLTLHPLVVSVDASSQEFYQYRSGVYNSSTCSTTVPNHSMLLVGFNATSDPPYYRLKNSWGTAWGEEGYIRMAMNKQDGPGMCGIQANVLNPLIAT